MTRSQTLWNPAAAQDAPTRFLRRTLSLCFLALLLTAGIASTWSIVRLYSAPRLWTDFSGDYASANAVLDGSDPYSSLQELDHRYVSPAGNPPTVTTVNPHTPVNIAFVIPLARLPYSTARAVWLGFMSCSLALGVALSLRELRVPWMWSAAAGVGILWLRISRYALLTAQVDGVLVLLVVLGWMSLRQGRDRAAGLALGAAAAVKLFPLFLIVPLVRLRNWRAVRWVVSTTLAVTAAGASIVGWHAFWRWGTYASPHDLNVWGGAPHNLSLTAIPLRWLSANVWRPEALHLHMLALVLAVGLVGACVWGAVSTPVRLTGDTFLSAIPWMLLAAPLSWPNELTLMLPVLAAIVVRRGYRGITDPPWPLIFAMVVMLGSPHGFLNAPITPASQIMVWGASTFALLALAAGEWVRDPPPSHKHQA